MIDPDHEMSKDDVEFGEWFYRQIADAFVVKRTEWIDGIAARLQTGRPAGARRDVIAILLSEMTAFTAPGRYIYVTGRLVEYCPGEPALAFVIAHELAHHDLGHLRFFPRWFRDVAAHWIKEIVFIVVHGVQHFFYNPERECAADQHWISVCESATTRSSACSFSTSWRTGCSTWGTSPASMGPASPMMSCFPPRPC